MFTRWKWYLRRLALSTRVWDLITVCWVRTYRISLLKYGRKKRSVPLVVCIQARKYSPLPLSPLAVVKKARKSSQAYARMYGETQPVSQLVKQTAGVMQEYTQSGGVRPFGISVLVAGADGDGTPRLYQVDPSGAYFGWKATAIGKVRTVVPVASRARVRAAGLDRAVHKGSAGQRPATCIGWWLQLWE